MSKRRKWWHIIITVLSFGAKQFEDGTLGSGRKTAKAGKVAGDVLTTIDKATSEEK